MELDIKTCVTCSEIMKDKEYKQYEIKTIIHLPRLKINNKDAEEVHLIKEFIISIIQYSDQYNFNAVHRRVRVLFRPERERGLARLDDRPWPVPPGGCMPEQSHSPELSKLC